MRLAGTLIENIQATLQEGSSLVALCAYSDESKVLSNMMAWPMYGECGQMYVIVGQMDRVCDWMGDWQLVS
jgi:hypothetical protein